MAKKKQKNLTQKKDVLSFSLSFSSTTTTTFILRFISPQDDSALGARGWCDVDLPCSERRKVLGNSSSST